MKKDEHVDLVAESYMHINNGGVTISVVDTSNGPRIDISASHFGNVTNGMKLYVNSSVLRELADMLERASRFNFTHDPYCCCIKDTIITGDDNLPGSVLPTQADNVLHSSGEQQ